MEEFDAIEIVVTDWVSVEAEDDSATVSAFVATVTSDSATVFSDEEASASSECIFPLKRGDS